MRILAIETTDKAGSIALLERERLLEAQSLDPHQRSAQSLAPAIVALLSKAGWKPADVECVGVATGPGSFTGLRVGVTTAKMLAYALGCKVVGVNTLEVISAQCPADEDELWAVVDAQRNQVFAACFSRSPDGGRNWPGQVLLIDNDQWLKRLRPATAVAGPGLEKLSPSIPADVAIVPRAYWHPQAATIGSLAWRELQLGNVADPFSLAPTYFRASAAEEKRAAEAPGAPPPNRQHPRQDSNLQRPA